MDLLLELERLVHVAVLGSDARASASSSRSTRLLKHFVVFALPSPSADEQAALVRRAFRLTLPAPSLAQLKPSILVRFCPFYSNLLYDHFSIINLQVPLLVRLRFSMFMEFRVVLVLLDIRPYSRNLCLLQTLIERLLSPTVSVDWWKR